MTAGPLEGFHEEDIRPAQFKEGADKATLADNAILVTRLAEFVRVTCPACDSHESGPLFSKNGIDYEQCSRCETFYVNPRPSPAVLDWYYRHSTAYGYCNAYTFPAAEEARRRLIVAPRVDRVVELCDRFGVSTDSLLEIGAAFGTFCLEVASRDRFARVVALEPTPDLAGTCRKRGLETIEQTFEAYAASTTSDRFSVVANFEVLEHLFSPREILQTVHRMLTPGGLLVFTCPNGRGFDIQVLGRVSESVDHEHLNYFSPRSVGRLLVDCGFEVVDSSTPGRLDAELVRRMVLSGEFDLSTQPFLRRVLIDEWDRLGAPFQDFLVQQGLSSNMWIAARRPK